MGVKSGVMARRRSRMHSSVHKVSLQKRTQKEIELVKKMEKDTFYDTSFACCPQNRTDFSAAPDCGEFRRGGGHKLSHPLLMSSAAAAVGPDSQAPALAIRIKTSSTKILMSNRRKENQPNLIDHSGKHLFISC